MNFGKIGKLALVPLVAGCFSLKTPKANAEMININPYSCIKYESNAKLNSEFLNQLLDPQYTENINFTTPWDPIKKAQCPPCSLNGIEADLRLFKGFYFTGNYSITDLTSSQNSPYVFIDADYNMFNESFQRAENDNIKKTSYGLKLKRNRGDFRASISLTLDDYVLEGNADVTIVKGPPQNPSAYTQWSNATYKGRAQGYSATLGLEARFFGPFFLYFNASYNNAIVNTIGRESVHSTTAPNPEIYDYSPAFDFITTTTETGVKMLIGGSTKDLHYIVVKNDGSVFHTDNKKFWKTYKKFYSRLHKERLEKYGEDKDYDYGYTAMRGDNPPGYVLTIKDALKEADESWADFIEDLKELDDRSEE